MQTLSLRHGCQFSEGVYQHCDASHDEDKMCHEVIREGFKDHFSGETATSNFCENSIDNVINYVNNLLEQNMHVVADLAETKSHTTKTDFWLVSPRTSKATDQYMSDLAQATHSTNLSDAKYLKQLKRKIPIFNKTDELLLAFYERKVPLAHAVWFIKLTKATQSCKEQIKSMEKTYHEYAEVIKAVICYNSSAKQLVFYLLELLRVLNHELLVADEEYTVILIDLAGSEEMMKHNFFVKKILSELSLLQSSVISSLGVHTRSFADVIAGILKHYIKKFKKLIELKKSTEHTKSVLETCSWILLRFYAKSPLNCNFTHLGMSTDSIFDCFNLILAGTHQPFLSKLRSKATKLLKWRTLLHEISSSIPSNRTGSLAGFCIKFTRLLHEILIQQPKSSSTVSNFSMLVKDVHDGFQANVDKTTFVECVTQCLLAWSISSTSFDLQRSTVVMLCLRDLFLAQNTSTNNLSVYYRQAVNCIKNYLSQQPDIDNVSEFIEMLLDYGFVNVTDILTSPALGSHLSTYLLLNHANKGVDGTSPCCWYSNFDDRFSIQYLKKNHKLVNDFIPARGFNNMANVLSLIKQIKSPNSIQSMVQCANSVEGHYLLEKTALSYIIQSSADKNMPSDRLSCFWLVHFFEKYTECFINDVKGGDDENEYRKCLEAAKNISTLAQHNVIAFSVPEAVAKSFKSAKKPKISVESIAFEALQSLVELNDLQKVHEQLIAMLSAQKLPQNTKNKWLTYVAKLLTEDSKSYDEALKTITNASFISALLVAYREIYLKEYLSSCIINRTLLELSQVPNFERENPSLETVLKYMRLIGILFNLKGMMPHVQAQYSEEDLCALENEFWHVSVYPIAALLKILAVLGNKITIAPYSNVVQSVFQSLSTKKWLKHLVVTCNKKLSTKNLLNDPFIRIADAQRIVFNIFDMKLSSPDKPNLGPHLAHINLYNMNDYYIIADFLNDCLQNHVNHTPTLLFNSHARYYFDKKLRNIDYSGAGLFCSILNELDCKAPMNTLSKSKHASFQSFYAADDFDAQQLLGFIVWAMRNQSGAAFHLTFSIFFNNADFDQMDFQHVVNQLVNSMPHSGLIFYPFLSIASGVDSQRKNGDEESRIPILDLLLLFLAAKLEFSSVGGQDKYTEFIDVLKEAYMAANQSTTGGQNFFKSLLSQVLANSDQIVSKSLFQKLKADFKGFARDGNSSVSNLKLAETMPGSSVSDQWYFGQKDNPQPTKTYMAVISKNILSEEFSFMGSKLNFKRCHLCRKTSLITSHSKCTKQINIKNTVVNNHSMGLAVPMRSISAINYNNPRFINTNMKQTPQLYLEQQTPQKIMKMYPQPTTTTAAGNMQLIQNGIGQQVATATAVLQQNQQQINMQHAVPANSFMPAQNFASAVHHHQQQQQQQQQFFNQYSNHHPQQAPPYYP